MKIARIRMIIWVLVALTAIINFFDDLEIYKQNATEAQSSVWIRGAFDKKGRVESFLRDFLSEDTVFGGRPDLAEEFRRLKPLFAHNVAITAALERLERVVQLRATMNHQESIDAARPAIWRLRDEIDHEINQHIAKSMGRDKLTDGRIFWANAIDLMLLILLSGLYWFEKRLKDRSETLLRSSMNDLVVSNESLMSLNVDRINHMATTVHDLKNPLGAIRGLAEIIQETEKDDRLSVPELSEKIRRISDSVIEMVNSLLRESAMQEADRPLAMKSINISEMLTDLRNFLEPSALLKNQRLHLACASEKIYIKGDPTKLLNAFYNILGNAIKYSPKGGEIFMRCGSDDKHICVEFEDQGPGLNRDDKLHAFEPGGTLSAKPTGGESSTGYGLFSARRTVEAHGGQISVQDAPSGCGAVFSIHLPIQPLGLALKESARGGGSGSGVLNTRNLEPVRGGRFESGHRFDI
jgi:signal transduction histidine kinase